MSLAQIINSDDRYYMTQTEPHIVNVALFGLKNGYEEVDKFHYFDTQIPKRNGNRHSYLVDSIGHIKYVALGELLLAHMPLCILEESRTTLFGHRPDDRGTGLSNSLRSFQSGLARQLDYWNAGNKYGKYVDIKSAYNSIDRERLLFLIQSLFPPHVVTCFKDCFMRMPARNGIPHGYTTSHILFFLVRWFLISQMDSKRDYVTMLNDDVYIYGASSEQVYKTYNEFRLVVEGFGLSLNLDKERHIEPGQFEDLTWSYDTRQATPHELGLIREVLAKGRMLASVGQFGKTGKTILPSQYGMHDKIWDEVQEWSVNRILYEELAECQYQHHLDKVDTSLHHIVIEGLCNEGSDLLAGREVRYLLEAPYLTKTICNYSLRLGLFGYQPDSVLSDVLNSEQLSDFTKSNTLETFSWRVPEAIGDHPRAVYETVLDASMGCRLRVNAYRALKASRRESECHEIAAKADFNACVSWNYELIEGCNILSNVAKQQKLEEISFNPSYELAINGLIV